MNEKREELETAIKELIEGRELSYGDVSTVLGKIMNECRTKGDNLLNATNIQKVIESPMFVK